MDMWMSLFMALKLLPGGNATFATLDSSTRTAETSERTATTWLFFGSPNRRRPRISAKIRTSMADNSLEKQQKQREAHASYGVARCLCAPRIRGGTRRSPLDPIVRGFVAPRRAPARPVQPTTHRWGYGRTLVLKARLKLEAERVRQAVRRHLRTPTLSLLRLGRGAACPSHRLDWPLSAPRR